MNDNNDEEHQRQLAEYFCQTMRPVVRTLMRFGFSAANATDLIRWLFVSAYYQTPEFWRNEPSALQCSTKTGISRSEIKRLEQIQDPLDTHRAQRRNRAAHVLFAWVNDPDFHDNGEAGWLPLADNTGNGKSFRGLVARYEADGRYQNILKDLLDVGCVREERDGVRLLTATYGVEAWLEKLAVVGVIARRNGETIDHNIRCEQAQDRRLHRIWSQRLIPKEKADEARQALSRMGIEAGRNMDKYLAGLAHTAPQADCEYIEVGAVIFTYEDDK